MNKSVQRLEAEAEARGYKAETEVEANILASRPVWPQHFNISERNTMMTSIMMKELQRVWCILAGILHVNRCLSLHERSSKPSVV